MGYNSCDFGLHYHYVGSGLSGLHDVPKYQRLLVNVLESGHLHCTTKHYNLKGVGTPSHNTKNKSQFLLKNPHCKRYAYYVLGTDMTLIGMNCRARMMYRAVLQWSRVLNICRRRNVKLKCIHFESENLWPNQEWQLYI
jgi:hypothetical protein